MSTKKHLFALCGARAERRREKYSDLTGGSRYEYPSRRTTGNKGNERVMDKFEERRCLIVERKKWFVLQGMGDEISSLKTQIDLG